MTGDQSTELGGSGPLVQSQQLAIVDLPAAYSIEIEVLPGPTTVAEWSNLIHFTMSTSDSENYGSRVPALWFWPGSTKLLVVNGRGANGNSNSAMWGCFDEMLTLQPGQLSKIRVTVTPANVQLHVNGMLVCSEDSGKSSISRSGWNTSVSVARLSTHYCCYNIADIRQGASEFQCVLHVLHVLHLRTGAIVPVRSQVNDAVVLSNDLDAVAYVGCFADSQSDRDFPIVRTTHPLTWLARRYHCRSLTGLHLPRAVREIPNQHRWCRDYRVCNCLQWLHVLWPPVVFRGETDMN